MDMDTAEGYLRAASLLPGELRAAALALPRAGQAAAEELRLRVGTTPTVLLPDGERPLPGGRGLTANDIRGVLEVATRASAHTAAESLRQGFVTVRGGCRVGFCGEAVVSGGEITGLRSLSSAAIRIPRQVRGCADSVWPVLRQGGFQSTLLLSPPGVGKTTLLRELIRLLSEGGWRVSLADERGEVAAVWEGEAQLDVGPRTDVFTGGRKAESAMLLLRAMNPQVLAMDEISTPADTAACESAANCGVALLATAHARDMADLLARPIYRPLLERSIFRRVVTISRSGGVRTITTEELR
jgi:stage III sporulation protein AA